MRIPRFSGFTKRKISLSGRLDGSCEVSGKKKRFIKKYKERKKKEKKKRKFLIADIERSSELEGNRWLYVCTPQLPVISIYFYAFLHEYQISLYKPPYSLFSSFFLLFFFFYFNLLVIKVKLYKKFAYIGTSRRVTIFYLHESL